MGGGVVWGGGGPAGAVRVYEVAGEALGKQLGVCAHEPCRQSRATDKGEQRLSATPDNLIGCNPPIGECYFHAFLQYLLGILAANKPDSQHCSSPFPRRQLVGIVTSAVC